MLYVVGAWATLQAAALSLPCFGIRDAAIRMAIDPRADAAEDLDAVDG